jgi:hypothetical protein
VERDAATGPRNDDASDAPPLATLRAWRRRRRRRLELVRSESLARASIGLRAPCFLPALHLFYVCILHIVASEARRSVRTTTMGL